MIFIVWFLLFVHSPKKSKEKQKKAKIPPNNKNVAFQKQHIPYERIMGKQIITTEFLSTGCPILALLSILQIRMKQKKGKKNPQG